MVCQVIPAQIFSNYVLKQVLQCVQCARLCKFVQQQFFPEKNYKANQLTKLMFQNHHLLQMTTSLYQRQPIGEDFALPRFHYNK